MNKLRKGTGLPYLIIVAVLHLIGFALLYVGWKTSPVLLGMGFVAYTLGLRHAFDVDHIAAIDNTVRKLMQQDKNPSGVGFYFSIGHSSVVFVMAIITAIAVQWAHKELPQLQEVGGLIGMIVSGSFLLLIGILNLLILKDLYKVFQQMRNSTYDKEHVEHLLLSRGLMGRFMKPLYKLVNQSWHVYPLGFLFGLGFDTASEVALLAISASAAQTSIPFLGILSLPVLFAAGMSMMDTADGIFMMRAYHWAFATPLRKVYYNMTITAISVSAALIIGMIELTQVLSEKLGLNHGFWSWIQRLDFGWLGYALILLFALSWGISYGIWRFMKLEKRWGSDHT
ncbi:HoxN/HupN/NixA family nickel/cobalt transporter [Bacillus sp. EB600]|uniref:HoxN/HupN/NixA family nickel/cobalt transporter n=1 Tax=Bacillus sp. EB600 TaxID=2806345 RepID=UPI00210CB1E2|nr:HoxN/HupN/NixA family nickel/cobalt transporter [Bacillus sp. EB600]MCQ6282463.1 HoxN/HupN/NixA family nickel/cobalt transporter [Bacillus sp. EB600]